MKKEYNAPTTTWIEFRATNMVALSFGDETIESGNYDEYEQNTKEDKGWDIWGE